MICTKRGDALATLLSALALWAAPAGACLANDAPERWRVGVFGTLGALYHDAAGVQYRRTLQHPHGTEAGKLTLGQDSVLGAQVNARASDNIEGMVQAVSRWRSDNNWQPEITWAYLRLTTDDTLVLRLGRVGADAQISAESRLIGYASLPIRPSHELHANITPDYLDGGDLKLSHPLGSAIATAKFFYGVTNTEINAGGSRNELPESLSRGLILGYSFDDWNTRIYGGLATLRAQGPTQALVDTLRAVPSAPFQSTANALDMRGARLYFYGADVAYDGSPLTLHASIFRQVGDRDELFVPDSLSTAFLAGYRFGRITPYAQYSRVHKQALGYAGGLGAPMDSIVQSAVDSAQHYQRSRGIGVRVDFARHAALKFQIDRVTARHSPLVTDASRPTSDDLKLTLYGAAVDFAF